MIRLEHISKSYDGHVALRDLSLEFAQHETTAIIGPSGCGKSTLLRIILGLVRPDAGTAYVEGEPVSEEAAVHVRRKAGYVIQDGGLFPHLTARENVQLMARHLRLAEGEIRERMRSLARRVRLPEDRLDLYPVELSGGQQQRVGLMRALMLDPPVLLLDEPLGALDPMIRARLQGELKELFATLNKTVVLVTHDLSEAAFLADRVVLLRSGSIVQVGTVQDFSRRPATDFVREFVNAQRSHVEPVGGDA